MNLLYILYTIKLTHIFLNIPLQSSDTTYMRKEVYYFMLISILSFILGYGYALREEYIPRKPASYGVQDNTVHLEAYEAKEASYYTVSWKLRGQEPVHIQIPSEKSEKAFLLYNMVKNGELDFFNRDFQSGIRSYRFSHQIQK